MSDIEVWATGVLLQGFTSADVLANVQRLFPKATPPQIARFVGGKRFVVTRVGSEEKAKQVISALAKAGVASVPLPAPIAEMEGVDLSDAPAPSQNPISSPMIAPPPRVLRKCRKPKNRMRRTERECQTNRLAATLRRC